MGVRRFRSIEEMDGYRWHQPGDPPGIHKHRNLESMNALQESWAAANFAAYHEGLQEKMAEIEGKTQP